MAWFTNHYRDKTTGRFVSRSSYRRGKARGSARYVAARPKKVGPVSVPQLPAPAPAPPTAPPPGVTITPPPKKIPREFLGRDDYFYGGEEFEPEDEDLY